MYQNSIILKCLTVKKQKKKDSETLKVSTKINVSHHFSFVHNMLKEVAPFQV